MLTLIDNYDSFTYNLYQMLGSLGQQVRVVRNDAIGVEEAGQGVRGIIISPGPGKPAGAGISKELVSFYAGKLPILGVCLGHQTIGEVFGGKVVKAPKPIHGMSDFIKHTSKGLFAGLPQGLEVGRYHSLVVDRESLPEELMVTAENAQGLVMALQHKSYPVYGVQFHPESILTKQGEKIMSNFLAVAKCF